MPPLVTGPGGIRMFPETSFFEATSVAEVKSIPVPVNKAHAIAAADALGDTYVYKFFSDSTEPSNDLTVLTPNDGTTGKWHLIILSNGGSASTSMAGYGSPEGVVTGVQRGQIYTNLDNGDLYTFAGIPSNKTGWI